MSLPSFRRQVEAWESFMQGGFVVGLLAFLIVGIVLVLVLGSSGISYRMPL